MEGWLVYDANDGSCHIEGIVTPRGARVVMENGDLIAVKWPGSHYHGGQGMPQNYAPGEWIVFEDWFPPKTLTGDRLREEEGYAQVNEDGMIRLKVKSVMRWPLRA